MFNRSNSLSINTGASTGGGLFGGNNNNASTSQPTQSGGLFGGLGGANATQNTGGGLFGNTGQNNQQSTGGGLFGSTQNQTGGSGGGLFGASSTQNQNQSGSTGGGLFGSSTAQNQTGNTGGGLFGSSTTQNQSGGGGLFGSANQQASKPGLPSIVLSTPNASNSAPQSTSLFGASTANPQPSTGLFGSTQNQQNNNQSSLFSKSNTNSSSTQFPSLSLGQGMNSQQQPQTVPGVRIDMSQIKGTTRFNDLTPELQQQLEEIDAFIQQQTQFAAQIEARLVGHGEQITSLAPDVNVLTQKAELVELNWENDAQTIAELKKLSDAAREEAVMLMGGINILKLPNNLAPQRSAAGDDDKGGSSADLISYYNKKIDILAQRLKDYRSVQAQVEERLRTVEVHAITENESQILKRAGMGGLQQTAEEADMQEGDPSGMRELTESLSGFGAALSRVAQQIAEVRDRNTQMILGKAQELMNASGSGPGGSSAGGGGGGGVRVGSRLW
ncbi:hypothetical protein K402DRAFT_389760 [Aulographum hederae CBS 113979]|uniref:Nucleoporin Nup54 alpha-helical domain-containing protein n=1 Tax=Aulographum hederae CBS 113979 TaxID=1176131 RepID=A0A6G1HCA2_9PEZI|nr:hypothetical protein K402DRAFT_389760 [Aulographum hederae CBS 113979]